MKRFLRLMMLALLGFALGAHARDEVAFELLPGDAEFSVLAAAHGSARLEPPSLHLAVDDLTLRANPIYPRPQTVTALRLGLARATGPTSWEVAAWSDRLPVARLLYPGDSVALPPFSRLIPVDTLPGLAGHWLVMQVETEDTARIAKVYAHGRRGMFAGMGEADWR